MKKAKKMGVSGAMLNSAKEMEATLARREIEDLEKSIPDGHPLREEANKQKALLGDLSGLPPGHPLIMAMQAAKDRYEQNQAQRAEEQTRTAEVRKGTKVDEDQARRVAIRAEEEQSEKLLSAAKDVNDRITATLNSVKELYKVLAQHEELLNTAPISRARAGRLKRLLFASERGLSECRISRA